MTAEVVAINPNGLLVQREAEHYGIRLGTVGLSCRGRDRKRVNKGLFFKYVT